MWRVVYDIAKICVTGSEVDYRSCEQGQRIVNSQDSIRSSGSVRHGHTSLASMRSRSEAMVRADRRVAGVKFTTRASTNINLVTL